MKNIYNFFASANTGLGFVNHFDAINPSQKKYNYILKGGPGTGKSTLMRKIGKQMEQRYTVEYFYCSSDPNSLDAVTIVEKNIAIIDGTAPHITEANIPRVDSEIINLNQFINSKIREKRKKIQEKLQKKSEFYKLLYKNLKIAKEIDDLTDFYIPTKPIISISKIIEELGLSNSTTTTASIRHLFDSAISHDAVISLHNPVDKIYTIESSDNVNYPLTLAQELSKLNHEVIVLHDFLNPNKVNAVYLKSISLLIKIAPPQHSNIVKSLNQDKQKYLRRAGKQIAMARRLHREVESEYIKCLEIDELNNLYDELLKNIET